MMGIEAFEISRWFTFMRLCLRKSLRPTSSLSTACDCLWHHWQTFSSSARLSFPLSLRSFAFNIYHWLLMFSVSNQPGASVHGYWLMTIGYNGPQNMPKTADLGLNQSKLLKKKKKISRNIFTTLRVKSLQKSWKSQTVWLQQSSKNNEIATFWPFFHWPICIHERKGKPIAMITHVSILFGRLS